MAELDRSYQLLACQYLARQLDALTKEIRGVRENVDIEPVHQARVASRRMRAALGMFAGSFDARKIGKWQKRIKRLTQGLGDARDLDVQIEFIQAFATGLDAKDRKCKPGIKRLLLRLQQRRDAIQPTVVKTLEAVSKGNTLAEMYGQLETIRFMLRSDDVSLRSPFVFHEAAAHIRQRRGDLLALEHTLADTQDYPGHHQLRIAAKKFRYTMEICNAAYDGSLDPAIKVAKKLQTLLGDIHDCDVWGQNIQAFMEQERAQTMEYFGHHRPFNRLKPGLSLLCEDRRAHRQATFLELVAYWHKLSENHFWDNLETLLQSHLTPAGEPESEIESEPQEVKTDDVEDKASDHCADQ